MKIESLDSRKPAATIEIALDRQRRDLVGALDHRGAQPVAILDGNLEAFHQRPCVATEPLLARYQRIAVVLVLHLARLQVLRSTDIVVRTDDEAGVFTRQELPHCL